MQSPLRQVETARKTGFLARLKHAAFLGYVYIDSAKVHGYNTQCAAEKRHTKTGYGGVAQLARAFGSYPECHLFESDRRYHKRTVILIESYRSFSLPKKPMIRAIFTFLRRKASRYGVF